MWYDIPTRIIWRTQKYQLRLMLQHSLFSISLDTAFSPYFWTSTKLMRRCLGFE